MICALAARLLVLCLTWGRVSHGDPLAYQIIAENVATGHGMVVADPISGTEYRAFYPPLYPLLLALVGSVFGLGQPVVLLLNFLIDASTAAVVLLIGAQAGFRRAGAVAAAIYLLWPSTVLFAPIAQKEGLGALLAVSSASLLLRAKTQPSVYLAGLFGLVAGLTALNQPALAPLPLLFVIALLPEIRHSMRPVMPIAAIGMAALAMLPWWIRNAIVFGAFVPFTTGSGMALWMGAFNPGEWWTAPDHRLLGGNELQMSSDFAAAARDWIAHHPGQYLLQCIEKAGRGVMGGWWAIDRLTRMDPPVPALVRFVPITLALAAALNAAGAAGAIAIRGPLARLLIACLAQMLIFQMWFEFSERHTYFMIPFLMLASTAGVASVIGSLPRRQN